MPRLSVAGQKFITPSKPFTPPKLPQGKAPSSGTAARTSASGYGKVNERSSGTTQVPSQKGLR